MQVSLSHEAQADASAAVDWYINEKALAAADDFASELGHALTLLSHFPNWANPAPSKPGCCHCKVFPIPSSTVSIMIKSV